MSLDNLAPEPSDTNLAQATANPPEITATPKPQKRRPNKLGFLEPVAWKRDDGTRREPVLDMDRRPPRVVRYVGWRACMRCRQMFWSEDVAGLRLCTDTANRQGCRSRDDLEGV